MAASSSAPRADRPAWPGRPGPALAWLGLSAILLVGIALRAWILSSPLGEVEADESVVGLMALHIQAGETPLFYWGQPYLGSLEAYLVAAAFTLVGPSNLVLKTVPGLVYMVFVVFVYLGARRDFGPRAALLSAVYLALPPSFLAFWSVKARGGYVELLALGQALLLLAPWVVRGPRRLAAKLGLAGFVAGLLVWTHVLGLAYIAPVAIYLLARLGRRLRWAPLLAGLAGALLGLTPAVIYNLQSDGETLAVLAAGGSSEQGFQDNLATLTQVGLPVMLGLGQATSSPQLFAQDWPHRPASRPWVPPLLLVGAALALLPALPAAVASLRSRPAADRAGAFFGLVLLALAPPLASLGRLGELVAEPRYALPLYSAVPLFAAGLGGLWSRARWLAGLLGLAVFAVNGYSLASADPRLNLPTTAAGSNAANRAELLAALEARHLTEVYADYWLAYPLMFESQERVLASVSSGGFNRFAPYAYFVAVSERPAFVFVGGSAEGAEFARRLERLGGRAERERISIYDLYYAVEPLEPLRP